MCRILLNVFEKKNQTYSKELCSVAVDTALQPKKRAWPWPVGHITIQGITGKVRCWREEKVFIKRKVVTIRKDSKFGN